MVQRKVTNNKLGIQADEVKTKRLNSVNLKPSPFQHHDAAKNKGADLAKKMKKTRPAKLGADIDRLNSVSGRMRKPHDAASPPKKPGAGRSPDATPNYMKSTSSSDARKERLRLHPNPRNLQSEFDAEKSNGKTGSGSAPKAARRTSSLKLVRALTKTTSFKPTRASGKRCSSPEAQAQRATCSSTLKDSKFPAFLELTPGGTESAIRVCPFTYCSLNGHHHSPSPPLKSFVSARRRMLKAQRVPKQKPKSDEPSPSRECDFLVQIYGKGTADIPVSFSPVEEPPGSEVKSRGLEKIPLYELNLSSISAVSVSTKPECDEVEGREIIPMGSDLSDMDWEADNSCVSNRDFDLEFDSWIFPSKPIQVVDDTQEQVFDEECVSSMGDSYQNFKIQEGPDLYWGTIEVEDSGKAQEPYPTCHNILEDNNPSEDIWDLESQDFQSESEEMNGNYSPEMGNSVFEDEGDDVSSKEETGNSMLDAAEATNYASGGLDDNHPGDLSVVYGKSGEHFAEESCDKLKWRTGSKLFPQEVEEPREFNPRGPNFLPVEAAPDAEKVDLKHQTMDDIKNTDEWMLDYAIQQAVTKLAPARNKRVALLVEAFETVLPPPRFKTQQRNAMPAFANARTIQACS